MNIKLVSKHVGVVCMLIGIAMAFSLPWAIPKLGHRQDETIDYGFETNGFWALVISILVSLAVGSGLRWYGRDSSGSLFRKEAMAIVGISWFLATFLGGLPYWIGNTYRGASVRLFEDNQQPQVFAFSRSVWGQWIEKERLDEATYDILTRLQDASAIGIDENELLTLYSEGKDLLNDLVQDPEWKECILFPDPNAEEGTRECNYRIRWIPVSLVDALFESQSGFSTTGATIFSELEDPHVLAHCLLFWRSSTHFLGGLGIIVLFVVILGHGAAGKAMMKAEITGPSKDGAHTRMQHTAWLFAGIYCALNAILTITLLACGLTFFDALCHAFATMATGGFSTYNASVKHFDSAQIDYILVVFMILAGANFSLLFFAMRGQPARLLKDLEFRTYISIIFIVTVLIVAFGMFHGDFEKKDQSFWSELSDAVRYTSFQVASIITTTGFATHDFDLWNHFGRGILFLLMFIGGCQGSTGGGMKVIRHVLFIRILRLELEHTYRPNVVRPLTAGSDFIGDNNQRKNILAYFGFIALIFAGSWLFVLTFEPDQTWGGANASHKLIDSASAVSANLNNIGPGLGTVGATRNYGHFSSPTKILFVWLMMLGRVEIFAILVLFMPSFWRNH